MNEGFVEFGPRDVEESRPISNTGLPLESASVR